VSMSQTNTTAPFTTKARAISRPIPEAPAVISTRRSAISWTLANMSDGARILPAKSARLRVHVSPSDPRMVEAD
jgi:hypothetical protein